MKTTRLLALIAAVTLTLPLLAADKWIGWRIPTRGSTRVSWNGHQQCVSSGATVLALRIERDQIDDVRFFDAVCDPGFDGLKIEMRTMAPEASIDYLVSHLDEASDPDEVVTAIALHDHEKVVPTLIPLARNSRHREVRRQALFWLGQQAGAKAAAELRHAVDNDPDEDVRQHAVFAISQLPSDRAVPLLVELVKTHKSRKVREKAMFWLAQTDDPRALDLIESILK
jgi:hypothetical protein